MKTKWTNEIWKFLEFVIFGSHLPAYTSCLVAATGAAALVGAAGVSIAEYQGKKQTKSTHHIHSQWQIQGREQDVPPPTYLRVWMTAPPPPPPVIWRSGSTTADRSLQTLHVKLFLINLPCTYMPS